MPVNGDMQKMTKSKNHEYQYNITSAASRQCQRDDVSSFINQNNYYQF